MTDENYVQKLENKSTLQNLFTDKTLPRMESAEQVQIEFMREYVCKNEIDVFNYFQCNAFNDPSCKINLTPTVNNKNYAENKDQAKHCFDYIPILVKKNNSNTSTLNLWVHVSVLNFAIQHKKINKKNALTLYFKIFYEDKYKYLRQIFLNEGLKTKIEGSENAFEFLNVYRARNKGSPSLKFITLFFLSLVKSKTVVVDKNIQTYLKMHKSLFCFMHCKGNCFFSKHITKNLRTTEKLLEYTPACTFIRNNVPIYIGFFPGLGPLKIQVHFKFPPYGYCAETEYIPFDGENSENWFFLFLEKKNFFKFLFSSTSTSGESRTRRVKFSFFSITGEQTEYSINKIPENDFEKYFRPINDRSSAEGFTAKETHDIDFKNIQAKLDEHIDAILNVRKMKKNKLNITLDLQDSIGTLEDEFCRLVETSVGNSANEEKKKKICQAFNIIKSVYAPNIHTEISYCTKLKKLKIDPNLLQLFRVNETKKMLSRKQAQLSLRKANMHITFVDPSVIDSFTQSMRLLLEVVMQWSFPGDNRKETLEAWLRSTPSDINVFALKNNSYMFDAEYRESKEEHRTHFEQLSRRDCIHFVILYIMLCTGCRFADIQSHKSYFIPVFRCDAQQRIDKNKSTCRYADCVYTVGLSKRKQSNDTYFENSSVVAYSTIFDANSTSVEVVSFDTKIENYAKKIFENLNSTLKVRIDTDSNKFVILDVKTVEKIDSERFKFFIKEYEDIENVLSEGKDIRIEFNSVKTSGIETFESYLSSQHEIIYRIYSLLQQHNLLSSSVQAKIEAILNPRNAYATFEDISPEELIEEDKIDFNLGKVENEIINNEKVLKFQIEVCTLMNEIEKKRDQRSDNIASLNVSIDQLPEKPTGESVKNPEAWKIYAESLENAQKVKNAELKRKLFNNDSNSRLRDTEFLDSKPLLFNLTSKLLCRFIVWYRSIFTTSGKIANTRNVTNTTFIKTIFANRDCLYYKPFPEFLQKTQMQTQEVSDSSAGKLPSLYISGIDRNDERTKDVTAHIFRKLYASESFSLYGQNMSKNAWISKVLGHETTNFTTSYTYQTHQLRREEVREETINILQRQFQENMIQTQTELTDLCSSFIDRIKHEKPISCTCHREKKIKPVECTQEIHQKLQVLRGLHERIGPEQKLKAQLSVGLQAYYKLQNEQRILHRYHLIGDPFRLQSSAASAFFEGMFHHFVLFHACCAPLFLNFLMYPDEVENPYVKKKVRIHERAFLNHLIEHHNIKFTPTSLKLYTTSFIDQCSKQLFDLREHYYKLVLGNALYIPLYMSILVVSIDLKIIPMFDTDTKIKILYFEPFETTITEYFNVLKKQTECPQSINNEIVEQSPFLPFLTEFSPYVLCFMQKVNTYEKERKKKEKNKT